MSEGWFVYAELLKLIKRIFYVFYQTCGNSNVGWENYRTSGMLKFDIF